LAATIVKNMRACFGAQMADEPIRTNVGHDTTSFIENDDENWALDTNRLETPGSSPTNFVNSR